MTDRLTIALAQLNPTVGDIAGNARKVRAAFEEAAGQGADLAVFSELVLCGYPPEDLVLKPAFVDDCMSAAEDLARRTRPGGPAMIVGAPWRDGGRVYNAALLMADGRIAARRYKIDLPNYGVFDEKRVFTPAPPQGPVNFRGGRLGIMICEDMWSPEGSETLAESGAEILIVVNGSPYEQDKHGQRIQVAARRVDETGLPVLYVNQVGGQDELVFDGASFALDMDRGPCAQLPAWRECVAVTRWRRAEEGWRAEPGPVAALPEGVGAVYAALMLGLRDYVNKNGFPGVVLGLSGGIDSALSAAVAVDALGPERVRGVRLPSRYTGAESMDDATETARLLGIRLDTVPIEPAVDAFAAMLAPLFAGREPDITEENIQSRARGLTLMAVSNKFGPMVLSTGNKSEMSVGYATLYGDMCGGYSVLKDVYKTAVYALAKWRNQERPEGALGPAGRAIPEHSIARVPTAELKLGQTDQDTLPPYDLLDAILQGLIEEELSVRDLVARGYDRAVVERVWRMVLRAEYKRRQACPGVKITRRAFGRDRRYPITNSYQPGSGLVAELTEPGVAAK
ncbi:MAG: NAD+ synthase [Rhodospirillaceae bacterium]|nr:NAD+ synthase [Rhodospirillaceae bacterium]